MKTAVVFLLALILHVASAIGADDPVARIPTLDALYAAELAEAKTPIVGVDAEYRENLKTYGKKVQDAGNLDALLAANKALEDLEAGKPLVLSADAGVSGIQKSYGAKRKSAAVEALKAVEKVNRTYVTKYKELVTDLAKANKVEEALKVQEKIDGILESARQTTESLGGGGGELDAEYWRKKALAEYPDLANPNSPLAQKVRTRTKELKGSKPGYFNDVKWPYLITRECAEALQTAGTAVESGKASPYQGVFSGDKGRIFYLIAVDGKGVVSGLQFPVGTKSPSLISGRCAGGRLKARWTQEGTGSKHEMEFGFQDDGTVRMEGEHEYGGVMRHHKVTLEKVTDPAEYRRVLAEASKVVDGGPKQAVLKTLEKTPPKEDDKSKTGRKVDGR